MSDEYNKNCHLEQKTETRNSVQHLLMFFVCYTNFMLMATLKGSTNTPFTMRKQSYGELRVRPKVT